MNEAINSAIKDGGVFTSIRGFKPEGDVRGEAGGSRGDWVIAF